MSFFYENASIQSKISVYNEVVGTLGPRAAEVVEVRIFTLLDLQKMLGMAGRPGGGGRRGRGRGGEGSVVASGGR